MEISPNIPPQPALPYTRVRDLASLLLSYHGQPETCSLQKLLMCRGDVHAEMKGYQVNLPECLGQILCKQARALG